ncbi:hypothetical protein FSP39_017953 [Pinctada imbricata]|uniref:Reverse transcriptase domain-containing protein n=1 Tax=Pinctada imbricata TaxID=66713 RepID=A0AA88YFL3_PINIB|nr:hypothetical protein FSP39_017953 [Pinctada imbricata]
MSSTVCLSNLLKEVSCDIAVITEHKLHGNHRKYLDSIDVNYCSVAKCQHVEGQLYGKSGVAILYKKALEFSVTEIDIMSDRMVGLQFMNRSGAKIFILGVYLTSENNIEKYREEISLLSDLYVWYSSQGHVIIMGDMNSSLYGQSNVQKSQLLRKFVTSNFLCFNGGDIECVGSPYTFIPTRSIIDYIFVDVVLCKKISYCKIYEEGSFSDTSDHLPMLIEIDIECTPHKLVDISRKWPAWHKINDELKLKYELEVQTRISELSDTPLVTKEEIDSYCEILSNVLVVSANKILPCTTYNPHTKPYWTKDVKIAHKNEREKRLEWISAGRPRGMAYLEYAEYKRAKRQFRNCQQMAMEKYIEGVNIDIDNAAGCDVRLFWKLMKRLQPRDKRVYPEIIYKDVVANTPESVSGTFSRYYQDVNSLTDDELFDNEHYKIILDQYLDIKSNVTSSTNLPGGPIMEDEIHKCIRSLKNRKAPDVDLLQAEHLKYGGKTVIVCLRKLFNAIVSNGRIPSAWKKSLIVPVYKGGKKPKNTPDSYRPVSLLSTALKTFEKVLYDRLCTNILDESAFSKQQQGFQKSLSCVTASFNLQETINYYMEQKSMVYSAFLDSQKAFDTVWRQGLMVKLHRLGVRGKLWSIIDDCHMDTQNAVVVNNCTSPWYETLQGLKQGGVLSGILYNIFINDLLYQLEHYYPNFGIGGVRTSNPTYADDITCLTSSALNLQKLLDCCLEYSKKWRFHFNAAKSYVVVFGARNRITYKWRIGMDERQIADSFTHLGILQSSTGSSFNRTMNACTKGRNAYFAIKSSLSSGANPLSLCSLYQKVVLPASLYGCELWNNTRNRNLVQLNKMQHFIVKDIQKLPTRTRSDICEPMLGLLPISAEIDKRKLLFLEKLCNLSAETLSKQIFLQRLFHYITPGNNVQNVGFVPDIFALLSKYSLMEHICAYIFYGSFPQKVTWKRLVKNAIHEYHNRAWSIRTSADTDFTRFRALHNAIGPAFIWSSSTNFQETQLAYFIAKLWASPPVSERGTCPICTNSYFDMFVHIVVSCIGTSLIRDNFWCDIIEYFDLRLCVELAGLDDNDFYLTLLGKPLNLQLDGNDLKEFRFLCFRFIRIAAAFYNRLLNINNM